MPLICSRKSPTVFVYKNRTKIRFKRPFTKIESGKNNESFCRICFFEIFQNFSKKIKIFAKFPIISKIFQLVLFDFLWFLMIFRVFFENFWKFQRFHETPLGIVLTFPGIFGKSSKFSRISQNSNMASFSPKRSRSTDHPKARRHKVPSWGKKFVTFPKVKIFSCVS